MKYKNVKATIIVSILLGLTSCNGEDDSKSEILENSDNPSEENVLSIDQIKNSQEEFLVQEIENPDEKEPEKIEEPELDKDEIEAEAETKDETEDDEIENDETEDDEEVVEDAEEDTSNEIK
jgi:hypothetical protein